MPERPVERVAKYNLSGAVEDTYASKTSQNPATSRKITSLIPLAAGYLEREKPNAIWGNATLPSGVVWIKEFSQSSFGGVVVRFWFAATATNLYQFSGSPTATGTWTLVSQVGTLNGSPVAVTINNLFHLSDGVNSFVFDGTNWVVDGLPIPVHSPVFVVDTPLPPANITSISRVNGVTTINYSSVIGVDVGVYLDVNGVSDNTFNGTFPVSAFISSTNMQFLQPGQADASLGAGGTTNISTFNVTSNRFYWTTYIDNSDTHPHESSSSPRSVIGTGPLTNKFIEVRHRAGTWSCSAGSAIITGVGTDFDQTDVGMVFYGPRLSTPTVIISVQDSQHLTLANQATTTVLISPDPAIFPARATHWGIYCSETENSNVGFFLMKTSVTTQRPLPLDQSDFTNVPGSYINTALQRPIRNDQATGTKVMSVHKRRIFRRNEQLPNFFNYTAFEEVKSTGVGTAEECVPGHDDNSISDLVNEQSYPEQSRIITSMVDHADALFIGTEASVIPLFGETIDDFVLSQVTAFSVGMAGRYATRSTPHGLVFLSYDRKLYLWPQQWIPFYAPEETTTLIEISRPKRTTFQAIDPTTETFVEFFNYGKRNWIVVSFTLTDTTKHTYVFDTEVKGWFELQRGVNCLAVLEPSTGIKVLVGGSSDGKIYILDDPSGIFSTANNYPQGTFRPALIDFGEPDSKHVLRYLEFELSNSAMIDDITINYYLDPIDVDNPGTPVPLTMQQVFGANRYRGFFTGPSLCERVLIEMLVAPSQNTGNIYSITLAATPASKLAT